MPDLVEDDQRIAGPPGPLKLAGRIIGAILGLLVLMGLASGLWFLASDAGGVLKMVLSAIFVVVFVWVGIGYFRQITTPPPPDPEPVAVDPGLRLSYVCEMCGLELAVVKAAKERAPKHCGEEMVLTRSG